MEKLRGVGVGLSIYWPVMVVGAEQDDVVVCIAVANRDLANASRSTIPMWSNMGLLTHNHSLIELGRIYKEDFATVRFVTTPSGESP